MSKKSRAESGILHKKYGPVLGLDVHQGLEVGGGGEKDVHQDGVGEEEVHGCVKTRVSANGQDDEEVPSRDQVHPQEYQEEPVLLLWLLRESPEEELKDAALVPSLP